MISIVYLQIVIKIIYTNSIEKSKEFVNNYDKTNIRIFKMYRIQIFITS